MFPGFYRPRSNFYRLPNNWFALWAAARAARGGGRILALLKVVEYVIRWSWGHLNFDRPVRLSWHHFQYGLLIGKVRQDRGTGLSSRILGEALDAAVESGFLERHGDAKHPTYLPHLRPAAEDAASFQQEDADVATAGFAAPQANFFMVPAIWTDLTSGVSSEALILAVEYCFRHTFGWDGGWERPCWLTTEEFAAGRRYRSAARQGERYDEGIGYAERTLRDALAEGVKRGWLVWQETESGARVYALHLKGMQVAADGRFLGLAGDAVDERAPVEAPAGQPAPRPAAAPSPQAAHGADATRLALLEAQVRALTQEVQALTAALTGAGAASAAPSTVAAAESKAGAAESKAATAGSKAVDGGKYSTSYTDTPDTSQTPAPDTRAAQPAAGGGGVDPLPADLRQLVVGLDFRGRRSWAELATAYQADPARVAAWIRYLDGHRGEFQQPAGYLLQSVVRDGAPLPTGAAPALHSNGAGPSGSCAACGGRGVITLSLPPGDPDYGRTILCPYCSGQSQTHG